MTVVFLSFCRSFSPLVGPIEELNCLSPLLLSTWLTSTKESLLNGESDIKVYLEKSESRLISGKCTFGKGVPLFAFLVGFEHNVKAIKMFLIQRC